MNMFCKIVNIILAYWVICVFKREMAKDNLGELDIHEKICRRRFTKENMNTR